MAGKLITLMNQDKVTKNSLRYAEEKVGDDPHAKNIYLTKTEVGTAKLGTKIMMTIENLPAGPAPEQVPGKLIFAMKQDKVTKNSLRYAEAKAGADPHSKNVYLTKDEVGEAALGTDVLVTIENAPAV